MMQIPSPSIVPAKHGTDDPAIMTKHKTQAGITTKEARQPIGRVRIT
ncbi:MAG: hypothetical protein QGG71_19825 [Pirellulaceae bacterium]|jgi:hypothetical protein|nr:hypothetical protein [Pirellulaceae bacterium]